MSKYFSSAKEKRNREKEEKIKRGKEEKRKIEKGKKGKRGKREEVKRENGKKENGKGKRKNGIILWYYPQPGAMPKPSVRCSGTPRHENGPKNS